MPLPEAALAWPRWRLLVAIIGPVRAQRAVEDEVDEPDEEEGVDEEEQEAAASVVCSAEAWLRRQAGRQAGRQGEEGWA
jgi:hypothetical protein